MYPTAVRLLAWALGIPAQVFTLAQQCTLLTEPSPQTISSDLGEEAEDTEDEEPGYNLGRLSALIDHHYPPLLRTSGMCQELQAWLGFFSSPCVLEPTFLIHWGWSCPDGGSCPRSVPHRLGCKRIPISVLQSDAGEVKIPDGKKPLPSSCFLKHLCSYFQCVPLNHILLM